MTKLEIRLLLFEVTEVYLWPENPEPLRCCRLFLVVLWVHSHSLIVCRLMLLEVTVENFQNQFSTGYFCLNKARIECFEVRKEIHLMWLQTKKLFKMYSQKRPTNEIIRRSGIENNCFGSWRKLTKNNFLSFPGRID